MDPAERRRAREGLIVGVLRVGVGPWEPPLDEPEPGHLGLLVVEGLMLRRLHAGGAVSVELLNHGDLLWPWLEDSASFVSASWECLDIVQIAVLEPRLARAIGQFPPLVEDLIERALRRSRSMAVSAALSAQRRIEDRLLLVFWHLAERWGERDEHGVRLRLRLSHATIADLVAARRPSVTTALGKLERDGLLVRRATDDWVLRGDPPAPAELPN